MTRDIAQSAEEQSHTTTEITRALTQITQLAQDSLETAQHGFSHSHHINALSETLNEHVAYFRIH